MTTRATDIDAVRAFARRMCEAAGDRDAADLIVLNGMSDGRTTFQCPEHRRSGTSISGFLKPVDVHDRLSTMLSRTLRMRARDRALLAAGERDTPAWSVDVHAVAHSMLVGAGLHPTLLASLPERADGKPDGASAIEREGGRLHWRIGVKGLISGRVVTEYLQYGGSDPHPLSALCLYEDSADGIPTLMITGGVPPQAAMSSIARRRLDEIVSGAFTPDAAAVRVGHATAWENRLSLMLEDTRTWLAPVPHGIDATWRRYPWRCTANRLERIVGIDDAREKTR